MNNFAIDRSYKLPLPVYFNLADETNLDKVFDSLNRDLKININIKEENQDFLLFVDSYDEGI